MPLRNRYIQPNHNGHREHGYLLAGVTVLILIAISLLSSFAFTARRDNSFKGNYATGEHMANLAVAAHYYAQQQRYANSTPISGTDLFAAGQMVRTDGFTFRPVAGVNFTAEIRGCDMCPVITDPTITPANIKAASAYLHLRIRRGLQPRPPSDTIALLAGASNRGMGRVGFVDNNFPAGDQCDGLATRVRWGPESSACLNSSHFGILGFTDVQGGDIIVPVWETALAKMNGEAMYRYKQPERPDLNFMTTELLMAGNDIADIRNTTAENMMADSAGTTTIGNNMLVRLDRTTTFTGAATVNAPMKIFDQNGGAIVLSADNFNFGGPGVRPNLNVEGVIGKRPAATGTIATTVNTPVYTSNLTQPTPGPLDPPDTAMQVSLHAGSQTPTVAIRNDDPGFAGFTVGSLEVRDTNPSAPHNLVVLGTLNTIPGRIVTDGLYTAQITTRNTAGFTNTAGNLVWNVGSIDQRGDSSSTFFRLGRPNGFTSAPTLTVSTDCIGKACPDNITEGPGGGI